MSINVPRYLANYIDAGPLAFSLPSKKMYQGTVSVNVLRYLASVQAEKEIRALENTLAKLNAKNDTLRSSFHNPDNGSADAGTRSQKYAYSRSPLSL